MIGSRNKKKEALVTSTKYKSCLRGEASNYIKLLKMIILYYKSINVHDPLIMIIFSLQHKCMHNTTHEIKN